MRAGVDMSVMFSPSMFLLKTRFEQLPALVRRNLLRAAGRAAGKILKPALKAAAKGKATGTLDKSLAVKVKAYAKTGTVFIVGGAKSSKQVVTQYKDYRLNKMRTWRAGQPRKGPKYQNPAKYSHLAGPGRKGTFIAATRTAVAQRMAAEFRRVMEEAIFTK